MKQQKVLILGGTGMLGHTLFTELSKSDRFDVYATARSPKGLTKFFSPALITKIRDDVDANDFDTVIRALASIQPDIVINCIGLIKQLPLAADPLTAININAQLPHRISLICCAAQARMIHISTDCVFEGNKGNYSEQDPSDAKDLYGRTKFLGEVAYPHCVTLRTSIIGHELKSKFGLVEWFLARNDSVRGYSKAIFSGFPTIEIARIIGDYVIPHCDEAGVFQVSSDPISKLDLLKIIARQYGKDNHIIEDDSVVIDRSLQSALFKKLTGYQPPAWQELVAKMHEHYLRSGLYL